MSRVYHFTRPKVEVQVFACASHFGNFLFRDADSCSDSCIDSPLEEKEEKELILLAFNLAFAMLLWNGLTLYQWCYHVESSRKFALLYSNVQTVFGFGSYFLNGLVVKVIWRVVLAVSPVWLAPRYFIPLDVTWNLESSSCSSSPRGLNLVCRFRFLGTDFCLIICW